FGKSIGSVLGKRMEIIGGLILIGLGVKIVFEHVS
ncbi:MAG: manganese efflux pump, partial [Bacteroidales bacterium]|nr:manganese efflux pump [Bacteroidales bacterium]